VTRMRIAALALGVTVVVAGAATAGALLLQAGRTQASHARAVSSTPIQIDPKVRVPDGNVLSASLKASGVQVYQCSRGAWTFVEPDATLTKQDATVALHTRGPVWISTVDGSAVGAAPVPGASVSRPGAVPELLLKATENHGDGAFGKVTYVQRLNTQGGAAPAGTCTTGDRTAVGYTADYLFSVPAPAR